MGSIPIARSTFQQASKAFFEEKRLARLASGCHMTVGDRFNAAEQPGVVFAPEAETSSEPLKFLILPYNRQTDFIVRRPKQGDANEEVWGICKHKIAGAIHASGGYMSQFYVDNQIARDLANAFAPHTGAFRDRQTKISGLSDIHSDVDSPAYQAAENTNAFAVVVGVENYANDLPAAQFAERDAQAIRNHLVAIGYPDRNIKFLVGNRASRSELEAYLENWLPSAVDENSRVFFYFSGHGAPDPTSNQAYIIPFDGDPKFLG